MATENQPPFPRRHHKRSKATVTSGMKFSLEENNFATTSNYQDLSIYYKMSEPIESLNNEMTATHLSESGEATSYEVQSPTQSQGERIQEHDSAIDRLSEHSQATGYEVRAPFVSNPRGECVDGVATDLSKGKAVSHDVQSPTQPQEQEHSGTVLILSQCSNFNLKGSMSSSTPKSQAEREEEQRACLEILTGRSQLPDRSPSSPTAVSTDQRVLTNTQSPLLAASPGARIIGMGTSSNPVRVAVDIPIPQCIDFGRPVNYAVTAPPTPPAPPRRPPPPPLLPSTSSGPYDPTNPAHAAWFTNPRPVPKPVSKPGDAAKIAATREMLRKLAMGVGEGELEKGVDIGKEAVSESEMGGEAGVASSSKNKKKKKPKKKMVPRDESALSSGFMEAKRKSKEEEEKEGFGGMF